MEVSPGGGTISKPKDSRPSAAHVASKKAAGIKKGGLIQKKASQKKRTNSDKSEASMIKSMKKK